MKHIHLINPYNSTAMQRLLFPLTNELPKLYDVTTSDVADLDADLNIHCPWHTLAGLQEKGDGKHLMIYTHCNPSDVPLLINACQQADMITCMSFAGRKELIELGVDPKKLWVIYCAADQFNYRKRVIGIVGYPQPNGRKREHILLDLAWQYDLSAFQFLLVGNGYDELAEQLKMLGVAAITMHADDEQLKELYQRMDILLVTGYVEGGPLPLLEAMASGTKVLSPAFGYAADLLGEYEQYETIEDLYQKLAEFSKDSILDHRLARAWSWKDYVAEYALLIGRLLDESVDLYPERGASRYTQLLNIIDEIKPKNIYEIGTWNGNRAIQMIQAAAKYRDIETIHYQGYDLFEDQTLRDLKSEYSKRGWDVETVQWRIRATEASIKLIKGYTRETLYEPDFAMPPDLVFIDGGHSEATIENDGGFIMKHMKNTVVVFDDYYHNGKPEGVGCNMFVDNLSSKVYEVTHLPVHTFAADGREIGMVKVQYADISLSMCAETSTRNMAQYDGGAVYTVPGMQIEYAPRSTSSNGELERFTPAPG